MSKKILAIGSTGMVGSRFVELHPKKEAAQTPRSYELDITNAAQIKDFVSKNPMDVVINFAAYTNVGEAEKERDNREGECWRVNVLGVENLVNTIDPIKTRFIQISTDMVFSGNESNPGPYSEEQAVEEDPEKVTWYGYSKGMAEKVTRTILGDRATIVRIMYPVRAKFDDKLDYVRKIIKLYKEKKLYPLFSDQQINITYIDELAGLLEKIADNDMSGVFHITSNLTNPFELAKYIVAKMAGDPSVVREGSTGGRYAPLGGLKTDKSQATLGVQFSTWEQIIDKLFEQGVSA